MFTLFISDIPFGFYWGAVDWLQPGMPPRRIWSMTCVCGFVGVKLGSPAAYDYMMEAAQACLNENLLKDKMEV